MIRITTLCMALVAGMLVVAQPSQVVAGAKAHKLVIHIDQNDKKLMNLALNNVQNVNKYYKDKGEKVEIELVAYGPGLHMLRADTSPVKERIAVISMETDNVAFSACGNTRAKMKKKAKGKEIPILSEAKMVQAGVIRIMELQEAGWSYIRP